jgi:hypothetical protein
MASEEKTEQLAKPLSPEEMFPEGDPEVHESPLEARAASDEGIAQAAAATRARRKWAYVGEHALRRWAKMKNRTGTDEELVRAFFEGVVQQDARVERGEGTNGVMFAAWTEKTSPRYVRQADLDAWCAARDLTELGEQDRVLHYFDVADDYTGVEKKSDAVGVYFTLREKGRLPDYTPVFS